MVVSGRDGIKSGCKINGAAFVGRRVRVLWKDEKAPRQMCGTELAYAGMRSAVLSAVLRYAATRSFVLSGRVLVQMTTAPSARCSHAQRYNLRVAPGEVAHHALAAAHRALGRHGQGGHARLDRGLKREGVGGYARATRCPHPGRINCVSPPFPYSSPLLTELWAWCYACWRTYACWGEQAYEIRTLARPGQLQGMEFLWNACQLSKDDTVA
eukprot:2517042-Rhodomonas_salina.1